MKTVLWRDSKDVDFFCLGIKRERPGRNPFYMMLAAIHVVAIGEFLSTEVTVAARALECGQEMEIEITSRVLP